LPSFQFDYEGNLKVENTSVVVVCCFYKWKLTLAQTGSCRFSAAFGLSSRGSNCTDPSQSRRGRGVSERKRDPLNQESHPLTVLRVLNVLGLHL
jgi:hypothetical protein